MEIVTIGFTKTTAEHFFGRLLAAGVTHVIDVRLHNTSQLASFAKYPDLPYFLDRICGASYRHELGFAPTEEMLAGYRKGGKGWEWYAAQVGGAIEERGVLETYTPEDVPPVTALLCSEAGAETCHRRVVAEMLAGRWGWDVRHL